MEIRISSQSTSHTTQIQRSSWFMLRWTKIQRRWVKVLQRKATRRRLTRYSLLFLNVILLAGVSLIVTATRNGNNGGPATLSAAAASGSVPATTNPLDQLSSADIAVTVARMTGIPETAAVTNQADSENIESQLAMNSTGIVAKPQVVSTAFKSNKDIKTYVAQDGDTIAGIASKFGVTSDSIRWSNGLSGSTVSSGQTLLIPPVNGIVYFVKAGDTPESLAQKYKADKNEIIAYNDAEINGLKAGERIIIPNGVKPAPVVSWVSSYGGLAWGSSAVYGYNGYDPGNCTWFAANRRQAFGRPVPANWGNAITWVSGARASGYSVNNVPHPGDVIWFDPAKGQTNTWAGHVGVVDAVLPDGTVKESSMNVAGLYTMGYKTLSPSEAAQYLYIH